MNVISSLNLVKVLVGDGRHLDDCLRIGKSLPEYCNETGLEEMRRSLLNDVSYVAVGDGRVVGFGTLRSDRDEKVEISWLAVDPARRKEGIGRGLLSRIEEDLTDRNVKSLMVKTLSKEVDYSPFESTRRFYEQNGFLHVETVEHYDGWDRDPRAIYEKVLV